MTGCFGGVTNFGHSHSDSSRVYARFLKMASSIWSIFVLSMFITISLCRPEHHTRNCKAYRRPALNEVLTRICLLCHEMFSFSEPNLAAECSSNCFRNPAFNKCLNFFRPKFSNFISMS